MKVTIETKVKEYLNKKAALIEEINEKIWDYAEVGLEENKSVALYKKLLQAEDFHFENGIAGMPTAFTASYGSGKPVIGILAEYDALPQLSQEAGLPKESPLEVGGHGHGCGHNSLGAGAFGATLAVKEYIKENGGSGTIKLFGCPSEEKDNGKTFMARDGYFNDVDCAFTWHPGDRNLTLGIPTLANISVVFSFEGKSSHAASAPHLGRSALDSVELMNVGVNYLREHVIPEARLHYAYLDTGGQAPNVVQGSASVHYYIRAPKVEQVLAIFERVKDIAKGAALMSGTKYTYDIYSGLSDYLPNITLSKVLQTSLEEYGVTPYSEAEYELAKSFYDTLTEQEKASALGQVTMMHGREEAAKMANKPLHNGILPLFISNEAMPGSTDVGDVSQVTPTAQLSAATVCFGTPFHTWQMTAQGKTSTALKGVHTAAGAMATAAIKVLEDPTIAEEARQELIAETEGKYICPIPDDVSPHLPKS